jgi:hypothetical protein
VISSSQRPLPDNTQHSQQTDIHAPGRIRTHNLSKRAAVDLRLRPRGYWDQHICICVCVCVCVCIYTHTHTHTHAHARTLTHTHTHTHTHVTWRCLEYQTTFPHGSQSFLYSWHDSPEWAMTFSLARLYDYTQTPHQVGLVWTSDRPVAETSTWQHITLTTNTHPYPWRDTNPQILALNGARSQSYLSQIPLKMDRVQNSLSSVTLHVIRVLMSYFHYWFQEVVT